MKLLDKYNELLKKKDLSKKDKLILDAFKYDIFKEKPSKKYRKLFKEMYGERYPENVEDISDALFDELKEGIQVHIEEEKCQKKYAQQRAKKGYCDLDTFSMRDWFITYAPKILTEMRDNLHGNPVFFDDKSFINMNLSNTQSLNTNDEEESPDFKKWQTILDEMIHLLHEMDEDKCSLKNPYEKELFKINEEFRRKYGGCGDKLKTKEEIAQEKARGSIRMLSPKDFPDLYPGYSELQHKYMMSEIHKFNYMDKCKNRFFHLFSEYFWDLWD